MDLPEEKVQNIANIGLSPHEQSAVDRVRRMRDAGLSDEQIDEVINFAIEILKKKTAK